MLVQVLRWLLFIALVVLLLRLAWIDLRTHRLPNPLVAAVAGVGLAATAIACFTTHTLQPLNAAGIGVLIAALPAALSDGLYYMVRHQHGFGAGDIKLLAALGLYFGPVALALLPLACVGALPRLALQKTRKQKFAFGPFIVLSSLVLLAARFLQLV